MTVFNIIDRDGDGEVTLGEFMTACKVLTALKEEVHPQKLVAEGANFCDDLRLDPSPVFIF